MAIQSDPEPDTQSDDETTADQAYRRELLDELVWLGDGPESPPTTREMAADGQFYQKDYADEFGSWNDALLIAGFDPKAITWAEISDQDLLAELRRLADEIDAVPTRADVNARSKYSSGAYTSHFGTWNKAVEAAGLDPRPPGANTTNGTYSRDELIAMLRDMAATLGRAPSASEMRDFGPVSAAVYFRRFGEWPDALEAADINPETRPRLKIPTDELLFDLRVGAAVIKQSPSVEIYKDCGTYSPTPFFDRFDTWDDALDAADLPPTGHPVDLDPEAIEPPASWTADWDLRTDDPGGGGETDA